MKNVSLLCILIIAGCRERICIADECGEGIQTFNMLKRSGVNPTNHPDKLKSQGQNTR